MSEVPQRDLCRRRDRRRPARGRRLPSDMPMATAATTTIAPTVIRAVFMNECSSDRSRCHGSCAGPSISYHAFPGGDPMRRTLLTLSLIVVVALAVVDDRGDEPLTRTRLRAKRFGEVPP